MIRPEALTFLRRYREALAGAAMLALGLWWFFGVGGLLVLPALGLLVAGAALGWLGLQRARFRQQSDGEGVVKVTEGQIAYFGPVMGGAVSLRELDRLVLCANPAPLHWRLEQAGRAPLSIPVDAVGAADLFDAFASLPGLQTERMLSALKHPPPQESVIWQRTSSTDAQLPLH